MPPNSFSASSTCLATSVCTVNRPGCRWWSTWCCGSLAMRPILGGQAASPPRSHLANMLRGRRLLVAASDRRDRRRARSARLLGGQRVDLLDALDLASSSEYSAISASQTGLSTAAFHLRFSSVSGQPSPWLSRCAARVVLECSCELFLFAWLKAPRRDRRGVGLSLRARLGSSDEQGAAARDALRRSDSAAAFSRPLLRRQLERCSGLSDSVGRRRGAGFGARSNADRSQVARAPARIFRLVGRISSARPARSPLAA
jgi:hypothetical protein